MLVTLQDLKSNIFLIVSCECPHRLSDKLLKSGRLNLSIIDFRSLSRGVVYYAFLIESQAFFAHSFQNLSLPVQCPSRFALACSRSVDAHYRESQNSCNPFFKIFYGF